MFIQPKPAVLALPIVRMRLPKLKKSCERIFILHPSSFRLHPFKSQWLKACVTTAYSCAGSGGFSPSSLASRSWLIDHRSASCTGVIRGTPEIGCASTSTLTAKTSLSRSGVKTSSGVPNATLEPFFINKT